MRSPRSHLPHGRPLGRGAAAMLSVLAAIAVTVVGATPSHAAPLDMNCPLGSQQVTQTPGLTNTEQTVDVVVALDLGTCASLSHPTIHTGTSHADFTATLSCADLLSTGTGSQVFAWSTGETSTFSFTRTVAQTDGETVLTLTGKITSGLFTGDNGVLTIADTTLDLAACQSPGGLTHESGATSLALGL